MPLPRLIDPVVTIADDRGERHVFDMGKRGDSPAERARLKGLQAEFRELTIPTKSLTRRSGLIWIVFLLVVLPLAPFLPAVVRVPTYLALAVLIPAVALRWTMSRRRNRVVGMYKNCRLCPCCGYDLDEVAPGDDALTTCPECGASWQLPEPRSPKQR